MTIKDTEDDQVVWLTKVEAARYLRTSPSTLDRWVRDNNLTRYKVNGTQAVRFKRADLDALMVVDQDETLDEPEKGEPPV